jgi:hypothetical protein
VAAKPFEPDPLSEVELDKDARLVINADGELVLAPSMRPGPADDLALDEAPEDTGGLLPDEGELGPMEAGLVIAPASPTPNPASPTPNPATASPAPSPATADLLPPAPPSAKGGPRQGGSLAARPQPPSAAQSGEGSQVRPDAVPLGDPDTAPSGQRQGGSLAAPTPPSGAERQSGSLAAQPTPASAQRQGGSLAAPPEPPPPARAPFADLVPPKSAWDDLADTVKRESAPPPLDPADDSAWADLAEPPAPSDAAPLPDSAFLEPPSAALPESAFAEPPSAPNGLPPDDLAALSESAFAEPPSAPDGLTPPDDRAALPESAFSEPPSAPDGLTPPDDLAALPESAFAEPPTERPGLPPASPAEDLAPPSRLPSAVTDDLLPPPSPSEDDADEELLLTEDDVVSSQSTPVPDDAPFAALLDGARGKLPPFPPPAGTPAHGTALPDLSRTEEPKVEYPTVRPRAEAWTDAEDETPAVQTPDLRRSAVTLAPDLTHSPSKVEATISPLGGAAADPAPKRPTTRRPASFAGRKIRETSRAPKSRPASNATNPRAEPYFTRGLAALEAGDLVSAERDLAIAMTYAPSIERYRAAFAELKRRKGR